MHFGSSGRELFGAYRMPVAGVTPRGAALLCPPWGQEALVSHRLYRRLSERLSAHGYHVLRFDYFGTGDSAGERHEGDLDSWQADATVALEELRDLSGSDHVATIGVRLGAVIAWRLAAARRDVTTAVLWDPVVSGAAYVHELTREQDEIERLSLAARRRGTVPRRTLQGFPLSVDMQRSIEAVHPAGFLQPVSAEVKLFLSENGAAAAALPDAMRLAGKAVHAETLSGQTAWRDDEMTGAGMIPVLLLERMVEALR